MPKQGAKPITAQEAEELLGGGSLLDRIGRNQVDRGMEKENSQKTLHAKSLEKTTEEREGERLIKVSLYLSPEEINALDAQIIKQRQQTGRSPRRTHLIRHAIHDWLKQQN